jgi:hypothetical protein
MKTWDGGAAGVVANDEETFGLQKEHLYANLLSQGLEVLELKLQSTVLVTVFGSRSQRIKEQVYVPFVMF